MTAPDSGSERLAGEQLTSGLQFIDTTAFLWALLLLIVVAKIGAEIAERLGQPSVLGEILAGIVVGATGLGLVAHTSAHGVDAFRVIFHTLPNAGAPANARGIFPSLTLAGAAATHQALNTLAEIGVIILLFEIGLHSDLYELRKVGRSALWVGFAGVILPMVGGFYACRSVLGLDFYTSLFIGAALTATSVGITARVFQDMRLLHTPESQVVLGAAVADDVIGLVILAVVAALIPKAGVPLGSVNPWLEGIKVSVLAVGFLVAALIIGVRFVPYIERAIGGTKSRGGITVVALAFCLFVALIGQIAGLAMIVGAFTAGLVLSHANVKEELQAAVKPIADIFIPLFFAMTGTEINLRVLLSGPELIKIALVLTTVAVIGKVIGSMTVPDKRLSKLVVGLAMIPRGEVGLIYARMGIQNHWIGGAEADGLIIMVMATTLMTPPLLRRAVRSLKLTRGEEISPEMTHNFGHPRSSIIDREDDHIFEVDELMEEPPNS